MPDTRVPTVTVVTASTVPVAVTLVVMSVRDTFMVSNPTPCSFFLPEHFMAMMATATTATTMRMMLRLFIM